MEHIGQNFAGPPPKIWLLKLNNLEGFIWFTFFQILGPQWRLAYFEDLPIHTPLPKTASFSQHFGRNSRVFHLFGPKKKVLARWFKVTFSSPSWRSLNHLKGSLNHPKKVTKNCQVFFFYHSARGFHNTIYDLLYLKLDIFLALRMPSRLPLKFFRLNFSFDSFSVWRKNETQNTWKILVTLWDDPNHTPGNEALVQFIETLGIQSYSQILMIGVSNHLLRIVFRFHYQSQKVIGCLGKCNYSHPGGDILLHPDTGWRWHHYSGYSFQKKIFYNTM